jgi:WD40 repeat protein
MVGHDNSVDAVAVSPDGKYFATAARTGHLRVWFVETGLPASDECFVEEAKRPARLEFSPDDNSLFAAYEHENVSILWEWRTNQIRKANSMLVNESLCFDFRTGSICGFGMRRIRETGPDPVYQLQRQASIDSESSTSMLEGFRSVRASAFHPARQWFAVGLASGRVEMWSSQDREMKWANDQGARVVDKVGVKFDPQAKWLAVADLDDKVRVFHAGDGRLTGLVVRHREDVKAMAFSADGRLLATGSFDGTAKIVDLDDPGARTVELFHDGPVLHLAFSPDGSMLATGGFDEQVRVWDVAKGRLLFGPMKHYGAITGLVFHPFLPLLLSSSQDHSARWWNLEESAVATHVLQEPDRVYTVDFSADGRRLASATEDGHVTVWDIAHEPAIIKRWKQQGPVVAARFFPSGNEILTSNQAYLAAWSIHSPDESPPLHQVQKQTRSLQFSPDGKSVLSGAGDISRATMIWLEGRQPESPAVAPWRMEDLSHTAWVWEAQFHPQATHFVIGDASGKVLQFDAQTLEHIATIDALKGAVNALAYNHRGTELATGGKEFTIPRWDARTRTQLEPTIHVNTSVTGVAYSRDDRLLAAALSNGDVQIYELCSGLPCGPALRHEVFATSVEFSPDSRWLASGSFDHSIRLWRQYERPSASDWAALRRRVHAALGAESHPALGETVIPWQQWRSLRHE